jgi:hypothetical protein
MTMLVDPDGGRVLALALFDGEEICERVNLPSTR